MSRFFNRRLGFIVAGLVLVAAFVWVLVRSGPLAPVRVTVTPVARADLAPALFGIGVVEARRSYLVGPTVAGRVRRVAVDVGDVVVAGQLLAEMDPVDLDQRLAATAAAAIRAKNAVDTAAAQLADSMARREVASANALRYDDLGKQGFVSSSVTEGKSQELKSAAAQHAAAQATLAGARQDHARLNAERDGTQQQRASLRLLAPTAGVVTARDAEPGSTVVAGQAVIRLVAAESLWIRLRLLHRSVSLLQNVTVLLSRRGRRRPRNASVGMVGGRDKSRGLWQLSVSGVQAASGRRSDALGWRCCDATCHLAPTREFSRPLQRTLCRT